MAARILITGGSGRLGSALRNLLPDAYAPSHGELDVCNPSECHRWMDSSPDVVIHCAGFANALQAESRRAECWRLNVEGTRNVLHATTRMVYISTDYVFDGEQGQYAEADCPNPVNFYGVSKLAAEMLVSEHPNTLILRVPFRADPPWRFARAFTDQWTSCRFASEVAPDVIRAALSPLTGILHIGGARRSIFEMASESTPGMLAATRADFPGLRIPRDTSLDSAKWQAWLGSQQTVKE